MSNTLAIIAIIVSGLAMILGGVSIILHLIAPMTKTKWDDNAAILVDKLVEALKKASGAGLVLLIAFHVMACGANARDTAVRDSLVAVDTASQAFVSYDALHQQEILSNAPTQAEFEKQIGAWREKRVVAVYTISAAYKAIALVATDDKQPLTLLGNAVKLVTDTLTQLGVKL